MNKFTTKMVLAVAALPLLACAQQPAAGELDAATAKTIKTNIEKVYGEQGLKVLSTAATPMQGLYEVVVSGNQIVYVDKNADYLLSGDLVDIKEQKNLTGERQQELNKIDFKALPLDKAIKEVRGKGTLQVAVFSDPLCPYCVKLEQEFAKMDDVTIYTFLMPILSLHPEAEKLSEQIWCSDDKVGTWTSWMRTGKQIPAAPSCANPVAETMALGAQFGFNGTPTVVFPNGKSQAGYAPYEQLLEAIKENQK
ncbi:MAG: DsbC family protein [Neisseriaceae bacterium]|nr:DsbC family protein [Neisseriaceae bacterium]MBP6862028.1 DsbC family protein [Neisseriaceae bacterium]